MRRSVIYDSILILLIILENLFLLIFNQNHVTSQEVNSLCYFLSSLLFGIVVIMKFYKRPDLVLFEKAPVKRKVIQAIFFLACIITLNGFTIRIMKTISFVNFSDIIVTIQILARQFITGKFPYDPDILVPLYHHGPSNYLPMHWLPYTLAEYFHFDERTITFAIWCISASIIVYRATRCRNLFMQLTVPVLLTGCYLLIACTDPTILGGSVETMVAGYYMLLMAALNQNNFLVTALCISTCLLSRYTIVLWLPLWAFAVLISGDKKYFLKTTASILVIVSVVYVIPFLSKDWSALPQSFKDYQNVPFHEWYHLNEHHLPAHLYRGLGFAYLFYEKYQHGDIHAGYDLMQNVLLIASSATIFILAIWFLLIRKKIDSRMFFLGSFKIYVSVFLALLVVPYTYLMITANFISIAIFAEQSRYRLD
jgi:hypothetical protein